MLPNSTQFTAEKTEVYFQSLKHWFSILAAHWNHLGSFWHSQCHCHTQTFFSDPGISFVDLPSDSNTQLGLRTSALAPGYQSGQRCRAIWKAGSNRALPRPPPFWFTGSGLGLRISISNQLCRWGWRCWPRGRTNAPRGSRERSRTLRISAQGPWNSLSFLSCELGRITPGFRSSGLEQCSSPQTSMCTTGDLINIQVRAQ